ADGADARLHRRLARPRRPGPRRERPDTEDDPSRPGVRGPEQGVNDEAHSSPETSPARYSGIRTFARLAHAPGGEGADVAVVGAPFDGGTSFRPGARFGPEAIRSASALLRPYDPVLEVDTLRTLNVVDAGDVAPSPGSTEQAIAGIAEGLSTVVDAGAITLVLGGDHTIALAELRALAARHGPPALVLLDSHPDTWDTYGDERYFHGTP